MTFTEKIIHDEKLKPEPGPGAYDHKVYIGKLSTKGGLDDGSSKLVKGDKSEKCCAFIEEA